MNIFQLYRQSGESVNVWVCGKCGKVGWNQQVAEKCCLPHTCRTCGKEEQLSECWECSKKRHAKKELDRYEKAEKVTTWDGWVFCDEGFGYQDGYFKSVSSLLGYITDHNADQDDPLLTPEYAWTCQKRQFVSVDAEDIYERIENDESAYEDFERGSLNGTEELETALLAFAKANEDLVSYYPDYSKAVLLAEIV